MEIGRYELIMINKFEELDFDNLMKVYEESNMFNAKDLYFDLDRDEAVIKVQEGFKNFLLNNFFNNEYKIYCILRKKITGEYVSALRLNLMNEDNAGKVDNAGKAYYSYLVEGLETKVKYRRQGLAKIIYEKILESIDEKFVLRANISKHNIPSLEMHKAFGFKQRDDYNKSETLQFEFRKE